MLEIVPQFSVVTECFQYLYAPIFYVLKEFLICVGISKCFFEKRHCRNSLCVLVRVFSKITLHSFI